MSSIYFNSPINGTNVRVFVFKRQVFDERTAGYFGFTDAVRALLSPDQGLNIQGLIGHSFGIAALKYIGPVLHAEPTIKQGEVS